MRAKIRHAVLLLCVYVMHLACSAAIAQVSGRGDNNRRPIDPVAQKRAQEHMKKRIAELKASGWKPKSQEERAITLLNVAKRRHERNAERALQKSEFQAAQAEAYMELAKEFASIRVRVSVSVLSFQRDAYGGVTPQLDTYSGEYAPIEAQQSAAYYGELSAKQSGRARAQKFRAETHYASRISNTNQRIKELEELVATKK